MSDILFALWFFLPAGLANATPIFTAKIPLLSRFNQPVDFGREYKGQKIFGPHKTIRGFISGIAVGSLIFALQVYLYNNYDWAVQLSDGLDYSKLPLISGFLLGFGALFGDLIKSFFKRQLKIASGEAWAPFDQLDYIIGGLYFSLFVVWLEPFDYLIIAAVWFLLHLFSSYIGYLLKLKKDPI